MNIQFRDIHLERIFWLCLLIPLSVDNFWSLPIGSFHLRYNYIFTALLSMTIFLRNPHRFFTFTKNPRFKKLAIALLGFFVSGAFGMASSEHLARAIPYLLWTTATLAIVPWLVFELSQTYRWSVLSSLVLYFFAQCAIVVWDAVNYNWGDGTLAVGRVFMATVARPHAFYQEPNYYASFAILMLTGIRLVLANSGQIRFHIYLRIIFGAGLLSVLLCTSKMGYLWLILYFFWEMAMLARTYIRASKRLALVFAGIVLIAITIASPLGQEGARHLRHKMETDESIRERIESARASIWVLNQHPLFGVGPGTAGAYFAKHGYYSIPEIPYLHAKTPEMWRNLPLSNNLITESLSEWGLIGTLCLAAFLFYLVVQPFTLPYQVLIGFSIFVVYCASQTLARFDLWLVISNIGLMLNRVEPIQSLSSERQLQMDSNARKNPKLNHLERLPKRS